MELRERCSHPHAELCVEVRERLVHEKRLRLANDRPAHGDPLALAARELRGLALQELVEAQQDRDLVDASANLRLRHSANLEPVAEVLAHAHVRIEGVALKDHRDVAMPRREIGDIPAADRDLAARDVLEAGDRAEECRLPAARRPDERDELPVLDPKRDVVDRDDIA